MTDSYLEVLGPSELARRYRLQVVEVDDFGMFLIGPDGRVLSWNHGIRSIFGYEEQEWLAQHSSVLFTEEDQAAGIPESEMRSAAINGRAADVRWHRRKDGSRVYMTGVLHALRDDAGELIGFSKIFYDDTPRKRLDDALTASNETLQQFALIASHDLQEPLRAITIFGTMLEREYGGQLDSRATEFVRAMINASQRMSTLVRDMLACAESVYDASHAESVHLDDDLETALTLLSASISERGAVVTHESLPHVRADRGQMVRLFQNLIGNSIKFAREDEPPRIHVWAERNGAEWVIRVRDNGIGFSQEYAGQVFAPLRRLHGVKFPGSGIGLAECRRIVERYGGRIGVESKVNEGSTFWFVLPAINPESQI